MGSRVEEERHRHHRVHEDQEGPFVPVASAVGHDGGEDRGGEGEGREPTSSSHSTATRVVDTTKTPRAKRFVHRGSSTTSVTGLKMSRCVRRENRSPKP